MGRRVGNTAPFLIDVKRMSLKMARACQLQPFNAYRRHYGLKPISSFEELTSDAQMAGKLRAVYGDIDNLEWFVGLFAEDYGKADLMGELLVTMVANDAFTQALTNPLLAASVYNQDTFSAEGLAIIEASDSLADVIVRNTGISDPAAVGFKIRA